MAAICFCLLLFPLTIKVFAETTVAMEVDCGNISVFRRECHSASYRTYDTCTAASELEILKTDLTDLSQFRDLREVKQQADRNAIVIGCNENLEWKSGDFPNLQKVTINKTLKVATIAIYDNRRLCIPPDDVLRLRKISSETQSDNTFLQKCHCDSHMLHAAAARNETHLKRCVILNGNLEINGSTPEHLQSALHSIHIIHGVIMMENSSWKSLHLPVLEEVSTSAERTAIKIQGNTELRSLHMPFIKSVKGKGAHVEIRNNPKLHLEHATKERLLLSRLVQSYFNDSHSSNSSSKFLIAIPPCDMDVEQTLITSPELLTSCETIKANIAITEAIVAKNVDLESLAYVRKLNGCLTIEGTSLDNLSFLRSLREVDCPEDRPPILIENNNIRTLDLGVYRARSSYNRRISVKNNVFLCREFVERWQQLLQAYNTVEPGNAIIETVEDGSRCDIPILFAFICSAIYLCGFIIFMNSKSAE
ncbi:hypothetical protein Q1695_003602 [Nippostrongylus brasiliensis]|nr:hypothetical protein Q1695_003602 [Nippostrongylus brasiliensis]